MPWENLLNNIRASVERSRDAVLKLSDKLSKPTLEFEHANALVDETNAQIVERLKEVTHGTLDASAHLPLSHFNDPLVNDYVARAELFARNAERARDDFESAKRSDPKLANDLMMLDAETTKLNTDSMPTLAAQIPDGINNPQYEQLHSELREQQLTLEKYANDLPRTAAPATADTAVGALVTEVSALAGQAGSLNAGDPQNGRLGGRQRVDLGAPRDPSNSDDDSGSESEGGVEPPPPGDHEIDGGEPPAGEGE